MCHIQRKKKKTICDVSFKSSAQIKKGIVIDDGMMENRRSGSEMEESIDETSAEGKERSNSAKNAWNEVVLSLKETREK